jgi:prevent-host-death family protein
MAIISLHELQQDPEQVLSRVQAGERVVVSRNGQPVAEILALAGADNGAPRPFGLSEGTFKVPDDFDSELPEGVLQEFERP